MKRLVNMWIAAAVVVCGLNWRGCRSAQVWRDAAQPKNILFLHSFGLNFQPGSRMEQEIQNELNRQSPWPLDIHEQSLVTARAGDDAVRPNLLNPSRHSMRNDHPI